MMLLWLGWIIYDVQYGCMFIVLQSFSLLD